MKASSTFKTTLAVAAITTGFFSLAGPASAQLYFNRSSTYQNPSAYSNRGYYSNPRTSGYGNYRYNNYGYGNYYNRTYLYRSPGSFDKNDDWYHRRDKSDLQKSKERFRDMRRDSRNQNNYYSNDTYNQNRPYDSRYYDRNIR